MKNGFLYFTGKFSDICKVRGYTVSLKEVEKLGKRHPAIDMIAVIAIPDQIQGNHLKAFVTLKLGYNVSQEELELWFKNNVSDFKRPIVEIRDSLPLSGKGDIIKCILIDDEMKKIKRRK